MMPSLPAPAVRLLLRGLLLVAVGLAASTVQAQAPVAFPDLPAFTRPTDLTHAGDGSGRLFVAEQTGRIYVFDAAPEVSARTLFLDLSGKVFEANLEGGLLALAFPPDYAATGTFAVHYVAGSPADPGGTRRSVIARYSVSKTDANRADPASERIVMEVGQPHYNHNGGKILFGPDGLLYIPLGDGGSTPDLRQNGQDRTTLLGSVLRVDVNDPGPVLPYGIPPGNPFVGNTEGWREEIWAYGFRSPWRASFAPDGRLWVADVGESVWEEIDLVDAGQNHGWSEYEAFACFQPPCDPAGKTFPVFAYEHGLDRGFSVTGGYVYRGVQAPGLVGRYVYADFITARVWALDLSDPEAPVNVPVGSLPTPPVAFGEDEAGELYVLGYDTGRLYDVGRWAMTLGREPEQTASEPLLALAGPNPFRSATRLRLTPSRSGRATVTVYDVVGRAVAVAFDGPLAAGVPRTVSLDGSGLPVGAYLVRVEAGGTHATLRLLRVD